MVSACESINIVHVFKRSVNCHYNISSLLLSSTKLNLELARENNAALVLSLSALMICKNLKLYSMSESSGDQPLDIMSGGQYERGKKGEQLKQPLTVFNSDGNKLGKYMEKIIVSNLSTCC